MTSWPIVTHSGHTPARTSAQPPTTADPTGHAQAAGRTRLVSPRMARRCPALSARHHRTPATGIPATASSASTLAATSYPARSGHERWHGGEQQPASGSPGDHHGQGVQVASRGHTVGIGGQCCRQMPGSLGGRAGLHLQHSEVVQGRGVAGILPQRLVVRGPCRVGIALSRQSGTDLELGIDAVRLEQDRLTCGCQLLVHRLRATRIRPRPGQREMVGGVARILFHSTPGKADRLVDPPDVQQDQRAQAQRVRVSRREGQQVL